MSHADPSQGPLGSSDASFGASGRLSGRFSGFSYEAEPCPECRGSERLKAIAGGGALGYGLSLLLGGSAAARLLGAGLGAGLGALASRWHLRLEWDPEALRGPLGARREA